MLSFEQLTEVGFIRNWWCKSWMLHDLEVTRRHKIRPFKQRKPKIFRGSAPNPVGGAYSAPPNPPAVFFSLREKRLAQALVFLASLAFCHKTKFFPLSAPASPWLKKFFNFDTLKAAKMIELRWYLSESRFSLFGPDRYLYSDVRKIFFRISQK